MEYRQDIDSLKGIAIIAVVLFHLGLLESGYLGVDIFFVINGFLLVPSVQIIWPWVAGRVPVAVRDSPVIL